MTNDDDDGSEWCEKSGAGMTQEQIDAWYEQDHKRAESEQRAKWDPNFKLHARA